MASSTEPPYLTPFHFLFTFERFVVIVRFFVFESEVAFNINTPEAEMGASLVRSARSR